MYTKLTHHIASKIYSNVWNEFNPHAFFDIISDNVVVTSQWVLEEMHGKKNYSDYLSHKVHTVKNGGDFIKARLAVAKSMRPNECCVALFQSNEKYPDAVVIFKIQSGQVSQIDMCMPEIIQPLISD